MFNDVLKVNLDNIKDNMYNSFIKTSLEVLNN